MSAYVIAELGINHNGSPERLMEMLRAAADVGVDAVKVQIGDPRQYVNTSEWDRPRNTPWGVLRYIEYREQLELRDGTLQAARAEAAKLGVGFGVSPLDVGSVERAVRLSPDWLKVASPMVTHAELLAAIRGTGLRTILSTGMSSWDEVDRAVAILDPWAVLHCVSVYPCPERLLNLRVIPALRARYPGCVIGYSGHEIGLATTVAAVALGAEVVERHLTLSRALWGSDQGASVEPEGFRRMIRDIRNVEAALGDGVKRVARGEALNMRKFRPPGVLA